MTEIHDASTFDTTVSTAELYDHLEAVVDALASRNTTVSTPKEVAALTVQHERIARKLTGIGYRRILDVEERGAFAAAGFTTLGMFLSTGLRLGRGEASRRLTAARAVGETRALTGERLAPQQPETAAAVADGAISADHVAVITAVLNKLPSTVEPTMQQAAEAELASAARVFTPTDLGKIGDRILAHLDPDGRLTGDNERQRQRGLILSPQDRQLMTTLKGHLTPLVRAQLEVILDAWAAPGMNNPADDTPLFGPADAPELDADTLAEAQARDTRTHTQRNHDALAAICRYILGHGALGAPSRLPAEVVVTTSLTELAGLAGFATTATGTDLPIADLVEIAAHAQPWLEVFRDHTTEVLYLGRAKRFATKAQRLALFGRDRGCTGPLCDTPFSRTQAHHAPDWALGGPTDIDHLGAACGRHNRLVGTRSGQWETKILDAGPHAGRMAWRRAGSDDDWQVNPIHHLHVPTAPTTSTRVEAPTAGPPPIRWWRRHHVPGTSIIETYLAHCAPGPIEWTDAHLDSVKLQT